MRATIEGNLIKTREMTGKSGKKFYVHEVIIEGPFRSSLVEVYSTKNTRKQGKQSFDVDVSVGMYKGNAALRVSEMVQG